MERVLDTPRGRLVVQWDADHLVAHLGDFLVPFDEVLDRAAEALADAGEELAIRTVEAPHPVGYSRLVALSPGDPAYWGYRERRMYLSHLAPGPPSPTRLLTAWGRRPSPDRLVLHTVFAGGPAPREIHDPDLSPDAVDTSITFWTRHALRDGPPPPHGPERPPQ